ncbi:MAG: hypothetical protein ACTSSE_13920 [Candidatus Thorarchaeota archaeon]
MTKKRGRPWKVLPTHPNRVISIAMRRGLSASLELLRDIKNKRTIQLYLSSRRMLSDAMDDYYQTVRAGEADHSKITKVENNVRRNVLDTCWENAAAYGNKEVRRVKKSDEDIGPLNQRFNICGAGLRNFGMILFPFSDPVFFGYQTRKVDGQTTTFRVMGYECDSYGPYTPLVHPDLPSMDFVDMIRHHLDYLATFCYIYDVPPKETGRYWNLYQLRARPYLDYIYSECTIGKKGFREETRQVLREIKEDIMKHYQIRTGDTPTVTGSLKTPEPSFSTKFFSDLITEVRSSGIDSPEVDELERLLTTYPPHELEKSDNDESRATYLREKDVQDIHRKLTKRVTKTGSQVHRIITSQLSGPWSLRNIIMNNILVSDDGFLVSFEVPVDTALGKGKVDILLSEQVSMMNETRVFQKPLMVFEIKTRQGHNMTLGRKDIWSESRVRHNLKQRVVSDFKFDVRTLDPDEWESFIRAMPTHNSQAQLKTYSEAVWKEYQELTGSDEANPLITGVILVESTQDIRHVRNMMRSLMLRIYDEVIKHRNHKHRLVFEPEVKGESVRVGVVVNERPQTLSSESSRLLPDWRPVYDPLQYASSNKRRFILYLDGQSPTSSGVSAGWIAKFHHGLHLMKEIVDRENKSKIVWIDLADQFVDPKLAETRLYLRPCSKNEKDIWRSHREDIQQLFESIQTIGLFSEVNRFLFGNKSISSVKVKIENIPRKDCLIVVSGMETIRDATPAFHRWRLDLLLSGIISSLPDNSTTTVLWFDSPVADETYSTAYSSRTLLPFYESSVLFGEVTEVVWNLPVASGYDADPENWPLQTLAKTPYHDDIRVIVTQHKEGLSIESTLVPTLTEWSKRFRAEGLGEVIPEVDVDHTVPDAFVRARMEILALSLIPWIVRLWSDLKLDAEHGNRTVKQRYNEETSRYLIEQEFVSLEPRPLKEKPSKELTLLQRVRFSPEQTRGGRGFLPVTLNSINSQRLYRKSRKLKTKPKTQTKLPTFQTHEKLTDIRFGMILQSSKEGYEWCVVVDPNVSSPLKIGLFRVEEEEIQTSLEWSVSRLDIISEIGRKLNRFDDRITEFLFRRNPDYVDDDVSEGSQWFAWSRTEGRSDWITAGGHDHVLRPSSSKNSLRAFSMKSDHDMSSVPVPDVKFPDRLKETIQEAIDRLSRQLSYVKHVQLKLENREGICNIKFLDPHSGEHLHSLRMKNTADLIELLRWPMTEGRPLRLKEGLLVTWDPFHDFTHPSPDIDFGEDYRSLESQLISVTDSEGMVLSPALSEYKVLQMIISHYPTQCPLVDDPRLDHASCWGVDFPSGTEQQYLNMIDTKYYLTDRKVLESVEKLAQSISKGLISIVFDYGADDDDRLVFNESEVMREISREYRGIPLMKLSPGHTMIIKLKKKRLKGEGSDLFFTRGTDVPE